MVKRLEKLAEKGKNAKNSFLLGSSFFFAALFLSPDKAEGQDLGSKDMVCERYVEDEGWVKVRNEGDFYRIENPNGSGVYVQDDLVSPGSSEDCYWVDLRNASRGRNINGLPSVVEGSRNRARQNRSRNRSTTEDVINAVNAISSLAVVAKNIFGGNNSNNSNNQSQRRNRGSESLEYSSGDYSDVSQDSSSKEYNEFFGGYEQNSENSKKDKTSDEYQEFFGEAKRSKDRGDTLYSISEDSDKKGHVKNAQGEKANKPGEDNGEVLYETSRNEIDKKSNYDVETPRRIEETSSLAYGLGEDIYDYSKPFLEETPYLGKAVKIKNLSEDLQGEGNPAENWYDKNLKEANKFIYGTENPDDEFFEIDSFEGRNDLGKVLLYEGMGSPKREDFVNMGLISSFTLY